MVRPVHLALSAGIMVIAAMSVLNQETRGLSLFLSVCMLVAASAASVVQLLSPAVTRSTRKFVAPCSRPLPASAIHRLAPTHAYVGPELNQMADDEESAARVSRRSMMGGVAAAAAAAVAGGRPGTAYAAKYDQLGGFGSGDFEVTDPAKAVLEGDKARLKSLNDKLLNYLKACQLAKQNVAQDQNADILPFLSKAYAVSDMRPILNEISLMFDEDSQRGIDRLNRKVINDIYSLLSDVAPFKQNKDNTGKLPRSRRRVEALVSKLTDLEAGLSGIELYVKQVL